MPTGIELSAGIVVGAAKPIDAKFGPYATTTAALADIPAALRYKGLTVGIETSGQVAEYWFRGGTADADFVLKNPTSSFITGSGVASMQVVTALPATPSPTTFYIVIPSGATTASAVTLGSVSLLTGSGTGGGGGGGGDTGGGGGGNTGDWTPAGLAGLQMWYAAEDASITSSGGKVSQWLDKSGNNRHAVQATAANQPTYFSSDTFGRKSVGNTTSAGFLGLICPTATYQEVIAVGFYKNGNESIFGEYATFFAGNGPTNAFRILGTINANSFMSGSAFATSVFKNAATVSVTAPLPIPPSLLRWRSASPVEQGQTFLFYSPSLSGRSFNGAFSEVLFFASDLSVTDRQKVEGYLAHKWNLAGSLPASHPYKSAAPTA